MLLQRLAVVLALANAAARPVGPRALPRKAVEQRKAGERRAGWTAKLKFLRDDWQQAVLKSRGGASSTIAAIRAGGGRGRKAKASLYDSALVRLKRPRRACNGQN